MKPELTLQTVQTALDAADGDVKKAAAALGYSRSSLYDWMKAHDIKVRKVLERTS